MDRPQFWRIIDSIDRIALAESADEAALAPLIQKLAGTSEADIRGFEEQLAQALYALDTRAHAECAAVGDDGFLYRRCFVVASGRTFYERSLVDPEVMSSEHDWCESLLYAAGEAWAARTGRDCEEWDCPTTVSYETGSNAANWK